MQARNPYPSELQDRFIVRLPDGMRERLAAAAKANKRSMNAELVARLEASFERPAAGLERLGQLTADDIKSLLYLAQALRKVDQQMEGK